MKRNKQLTKLLALHLSLMLLVLVSLLMAFSYLILPAMTHHGQSITVPNLRGYTLADAQASLAKRSLRWKVTEDFAYSPHYPPNTVIQQYPRAGAHVKQDRKIHLTLNTTIPPKVNMPNLVDGSVRNAHILLKSQELLLGNIKYVPDIAENAVLEQWHNGKPLAPGSAIAKGSKIDLVVGAGLDKKSVTVPSVTGMQLDNAKLSLLSVGIKVGSTTYQPVEEQLPNTVWRQLPEAGQKIRIGETVDLWVVEANEDETTLTPDTPILPKSD